MKVAALVLIGLASVGATASADDNAGKPMMRRPPPMPAPRRQLDPTATYAVPIDDGVDGVVGAADAKVTMIIASDYACPYCEKIRPTVEELRKQYGKDLRVVFHQFVVHPTTAMAYAMAACAGVRQGKFEAIDAKLWELFAARKFDGNTATTSAPQACWESKAGCENTNAAATAAGLDMKRLGGDLRACKPSIERDQAAWTRDFAVNAIPQVFINGRPVTGAQPIETFAKVIDDELAKANLRIKSGAKPATYYSDWVIGKGQKQLAPVVAPSSDPCSG